MRIPAFEKTQLFIIKQIALVIDVDPWNMMGSNGFKRFLNGLHLPHALIRGNINDMQNQVRTANLIKSAAKCLDEIRGQLLNETHRIS